MTPSEFVDNNSRQIATKMEQQTGRRCTFDFEAVQWLEAYMRTLRPIEAADARQEQVNLLGAFLGQCLVNTYGGMWAQVDNSWLGVKVGENVIVAPWRKVEHFLTGDEAEAPTIFFDVVGSNFAGKIFHEATYIM